MSALRLFLLCCIIYLPFAWAQPCRTFEGKNGTCILLTNCRQLARLMRQKPVKRETVIFLRRLNCGYKDRQPLVCCVQPPIVTTTTTSMPSLQKAALTDSLAVHPNWNLLHQESCGIATSDYIVGGEEAALGEMPWLALIQYRRGNFTLFACGGSLINKRYVLTAAHCLHKRSIGALKPVMVRLGEHNLVTNPDCTVQQKRDQEYCADPVQDIPIESVIIFHGYKASLQHRHYDIALIRLSMDANINKFVRPICLPSVAIDVESTKPGKELKVAGWGKTALFESSEVKMKVELPVVANEVCNRTYASSRIIIPEQVCAGGVEGQDSCKGDSGGPLMDIAKNPTLRYFRFFLIGIVSYGPRNCGTQHKPGVYTRVAPFLGWILDNLAP